MSQTPRHVRLANEYTQLINLAARSDFVVVEPVDVQPGFPPEKYIVTFRCRGIAGVEPNGSPRFSDFHQARLYLPSDYPLREPYVKWLTPIWHPNIEHAEPNSVCTNTPKGFWMRRPLSELVVMMGEMLQYKRYCARWERPYPVDRDAAQWVREYAEPRGLVGPGRPIDERPLLRPRHARPESAAMQRPQGTSGPFREQRPSGRFPAARGTEPPPGSPSERFITHRMEPVRPEELPKYAHPAPAPPGAPLGGPATLVLPVAGEDRDPTLPLEETKPGPSASLGDPDPTDRLTPLGERTDPLAGLDHLLTTLDPSMVPDVDRDPTAPLADRTDRLDAKAVEPDEAPTFNNMERISTGEMVFDTLPDPPRAPAEEPREEPFEKPLEEPRDELHEEPREEPREEPLEEQAPRLVHGMRRRTGTDMLPALPPSHDTTKDERGVPRSALAPTFYLPSVLGRRRSGPMLEGADARECPACERAVSASAVFCPYCGSTVHGAEEEEEARGAGAISTAELMPSLAREPLARSSAKLPARPAARRFCHWCGLAVSQSAAFCPHCGKSLVKRS